MDEFVAQWRLTAVAPETADEAELSLRRRIAADERAAAEFRSHCRANAFDLAIFTIGQEVALQHELSRRQHRKSTDALQAELQQVQNFCIHLQHRLAAVEAAAAVQRDHAGTIKFGRAIAA